MTWLLVAVGGALGAVVRHVAAQRRGAVAGTHLVNRIGAVLLGVVVAVVGAGLAGAGVLVLLGTGVAGGMTTFSTWMVQVADPDHHGARADRTVPAARPHWHHLVRETAIGLVLAGLALWVTRTVLAPM